MCVFFFFFVGGGGGLLFFSSIFFDRIPFSGFLLSLLLLSVVQNKAYSAAQKEINSQTD